MYIDHLDIPVADLRSLSYHPAVVTLVTDTSQYLHDLGLGDVHVLTAVAAFTTLPFWRVLRLMQIFEGKNLPVGEAILRLQQPPLAATLELLAINTIFLKIIFKRVWDDISGDTNDLADPVCLISREDAFMSVLYATLHIPMATPVTRKNLTNVFLSFRNVAVGIVNEATLPIYKGGRTFFFTNSLADMGLQICDVTSPRLKTLDTFFGSSETASMILEITAMGANNHLTVTIHLLKERAVLYTYTDNLRVHRFLANYNRLYDTVTADVSRKILELVAGSENVRLAVSNQLTGDFVQDTFAKSVRDRPDSVPNSTFSMLTNAENVLANADSNAAYVTFSESKTAAFAIFSPGTASRTVSPDLEAMVVAPISGVSLWKTALTPLQAHAVVKITENFDNPLFDRYGLLLECAFATDNEKKNNQNLVFISPYESSFRSDCVLTPSFITEARQVRCAVLALETGAGKSLTTIVAMLYRSQQQDATAKIPHLIVAPDMLVSHWASEVKKHTGLGIGELVVIEKTKDLIENLPSRNIQPKIIVIGHAALRSKKFPSMLLQKVDILAVDEAHLMRSDTQAYQILFPEQGGALSYSCLLAITATPMAGFNKLQTMLLHKAPNLKHFASMTGLTNLLLSTAMLKGSMAKSGALKVTRSVEMVQPSDFVVKAHTLLAGIYHNYHATTGSIRKILRIYERICAGGVVDGDLMLEVLKRLLARKSAYPVVGHSTSGGAVGGTFVVTLSERLAPAVGFANSSDECALCLCTFDDPCQLACGHILCRLCLESLLSLSRARCSHCRDEFKAAPGGTGSQLLVFKPRFKNKTCAEGDGAIVGDEDRTLHEPTTKKQKIEAAMTWNGYRSLLSGGKSAAGLSSTELFEKIVAVKKFLYEYARTKKATDRLVLFTKRDNPAEIYHTFLEKTLKLNVGVAGLCGRNLTDSVTTIQQFRSGAVDVLISSFKFAVGFDFVMASHVAITDFDVAVSALTQAGGRVTRVGQKNPEVFVKTFLLEGCFDEYLYRHSLTSNRPVTGLNASTAHALEFFCTRNSPGSEASKACQAFRNIVGRAPRLTTFHEERLSDQIRCNNSNLSMQPAHRTATRLTNKAFVGAINITRSRWDGYIFDHADMLTGQEDSAYLRNQRARFSSAL